MGGLFKKPDTSALEQQQKALEAQQKAQQQQEEQRKLNMLRAAKAGGAANLQGGSETLG